MVYFAGMTTAQLISIFHKYDDILGEELLGGDPQRCADRDGSAPDVYSQQQHLRWMCQERGADLTRLLYRKPNEVSEGEIQKVKEKAMRWLGFIQGTMWATGVRTVGEMRVDNKDPDLKPSP